MDLFDLDTIFETAPPKGLVAASLIPSQPSQSEQSIEDYLASTITTSTRIAISPSRKTEAIWPFPAKEPREVQVEALKAASGKIGFGFFMRQRLGKTLTAYAEFVNLRNEGHVDWLVVICPNSLKAQWQDAIEEVNVYEDILIYESQSKARLKKFFSRGLKEGVVIINYESMDAFVANGGFTYLDTFRTYCCADESTKIKDPGNRSSKAVLSFAEMCAYTRVLSGKPTTNSNADIWSQLKLIRATHRTYHAHKYTFCLHGGYMGKSVTGNINTEILQAEMAPHCYIAPDKYVQGFKKTYEPLCRIPLLPAQMKQYKSMEDDLVLSLSDEINIVAPIALTKYLRLQQISSGVAGDPDGVQHNIVSPFLNPRINAVRDLLEYEINGKTIIICRFKLSIDNLVAVLEHDGIKVTTIRGGMSSEEVEANKAKFNGSGADVLIAQIQVLSYGHTLPGHPNNRCRDVIFFENNFSLSDRMQCESRPEVYGDDGGISYWDFYCTKMDKHMIERLRKKEEGSLALMGYARATGLRPSTADEEENTAAE